MSNIVKKAYPVLNMHCTGCVFNIEKAVKKLRGITDVSVNPYDRILSVSYDTNRLTPSEIRDTLLSSGYDLIVEEEPLTKHSEVQQYSSYYFLKKRVQGAWLFTVPLLLLTIFSFYMPYVGEVQMFLAFIVMALFGRSFYINAWNQARLGHSTMDTLVALSTSVAFIFSVFNTFFPDFWYSSELSPHTYYEVIGITISFILTGRLMEERAKGNASSTIGSLKGFQPEVLRYLPQGQRKDDRIAGAFVPVILILTVSTFFIWMFWGGTSMAAQALFAVLSIIIVACPCALGLATPIALIAGISKSADNHILIKDAIALEQMSKVDVVVFDKAGTLTEGYLSITGWLWAHSQEEHLKKVLLAAELHSSHPLARAIVEVLEEEKTLPAKLESWDNIKGKGLQVTYQDTAYWVGSHKLLKDFQVNLSNQLGEMVAQYESDGNSIVYFGCENKLLAVVAIKDRIKSTSVEAIRELRMRNIDVCMLTGDSERTASAVAASLGIMHYIADARSEDKEDYIRELQLQGKKVAMVGDGINDLQALSCANISIVIAHNADVAMDAAMVTLVGSNLLLLPRAFRISHLTVRLMNKNLFWAFIYNLACIPIAAGILYPVYDIMLAPLLVSAAMALSCVSVLLNSLKT